jgi:hypothetical protein
MNDKTKRSLQEVLNAINGTGEWAKEGMVANSGGNKTVVAARLGVARSTIYEYEKRWAGVRDAMFEAKEMEKDFVEGKIIQRIKADSDTMIIFYSKTQMKDRGYIERQEINVRHIDEEIEAELARLAAREED